MENRSGKKKIMILAGTAFAVAALLSGILAVVFDSGKGGYEVVESEPLSAEAAGPEDIGSEDGGNMGENGEDAAADGGESMTHTDESVPDKKKAGTDAEGYDILLSFAGDICFDDTCAVMQDYIGQGEKLENNIAPKLLVMMREADVCFINNEFAYSDRGTPLENKMYTFRASPARASMLQEMGVDIAGLANNHVYDFGAEAIEDTFDTLRGVGIDYVGAGRNLEEAMMPVYREIDGKKIAYVAASRAEKFKMTPQATEDEAGILRCYDTELFL